MENSVTGRRKESADAKKTSIDVETITTSRSGEYLSCRRAMLKKNGKVQHAVAKNAFPVRQDQLSLIAFFFGRLKSPEMNHDNSIKQQMGLAE